MMRSARPVPRLYKMYQRRWAASEQILTSTDVGRMLELATLEQLQQWGMQLTLAGGRGDKGIDLKGTWPLRQGLVDVIVQCKRYRRPVGPGDLREFEAVLLRRRVEVSPNAIGFFATVSGLSTAALSYLETSKLPLTHLDFNPGSTRPFLRKIIVNRAFNTQLPNLVITHSLNGGQSSINFGEIHR